MKKDGDYAALFANAIGEFLSWLNILGIVLETQAFRDWTRDYHGIGDSGLIAGYKLLTDTCLRCLIGSITMGTGLALAEDYVFFRARFKGVELNDIPNTCEKTVFIKKIWEAARGIRESKDWQRLRTSTKQLLAFLESIEQIIMPHAVSTVENTNESQVLKVSMIAYTVADLNDTRHGFPKGQFAATILRPVTEERFLRIAYRGYIYALQYLWFKLVGNEQFEKSCLVDLHRLHLSPISSEKERVREREKRHLERRNWYALDSYFDRINNEISLPLERQLHVSGVDDRLLVLSKNYDKKELDGLLESQGLTDPEYLHKTNEASLFKQLDYHLLWYEVNVLDTQELTVFNGVPAFIPLVIGVVEQRKLEDVREKVQIRVFKHPLSEERKKDCDYSYGILIEAFSSFGISDYSGWLIFFDCANDYDHFGINSYKRAKGMLDSYEKQNLIDIEEVEVGSKILRNYLGKRSVSSVFETIVYERERPVIPPLRATDFNLVRKLNLLELKAKTEAILGNLRGKFFEYLFYYWLLEESGKRYTLVKCDTQEETEQIDVLAETEDGKTVELFECKARLHLGQIKETIKQMENKINALSKSRPGKRIVPYLVVFLDIPQSSRLALLEKRISVVSPFARAIAEWRKLPGGSRKVIREIMTSSYD